MLAYHKLVTTKVFLNRLFGPNVPFPDRREQTQAVTWHAKDFGSNCVDCRTNLLESPESAGIQIDPDCFSVDNEATEQPAKDLLAKLLHKTFALIKVNQSAVHHKKMLGLEQLSARSLGNLAHLAVHITGCTVRVCASNIVVPRAKTALTALGSKGQKEQTGWVSIIPYCCHLYVYPHWRKHKKTNRTLVYTTKQIGWSKPEQPWRTNLLCRSEVQAQGLLCCPRWEILTSPYTVFVHMARDRFSLSSQHAKICFASSNLQRVPAQYLHCQSGRFMAHSDSSMSIQAQQQHKWFMTIHLRLWPRNTTILAVFWDLNPNVDSMAGFELNNWKLESKLGKRIPQTTKTRMCNRFRQKTQGCQSCEVSLCSLGICSTWRCCVFCSQATQSPSL